MITSSAKWRERIFEAGASSGPRLQLMTSEKVKPCRALSCGMLCAVNRQCAAFKLIDCACNLYAGDYTVSEPVSHDVYLPTMMNTRTDDRYISRGERVPWP